MGSRHVHISDVRQFKTCTMRWDFTSPLRQGMSPRTTPRALHLGTIVHLALETWYRDLKDATMVPGTPVRKLSTVWEAVWADELRRQAAEGISTSDENMEELQATARGILRNYAQWLARTHADDHLSVIGVEEKFIVPLTDTVDFAGKFDMIVAEADGGIWIVDHKVTGGNFTGYAQYLRDQDDQARCYVWAAQKIFGADRVRGIIFNLIRNKAPVQPQVLASTGLISANRRIDTTWEVFEAALRANRQDVDDPAYADVREALQSKTTQWVMRYPITFTSYAINLFDAQIRRVVRQMTSPNPPLSPANYLVCRGCPFSTPCSMRLNAGEQVALDYLNANYVRGKYVQEALDLEQEE